MATKCSFLSGAWAVVWMGAILATACGGSLPDAALVGGGGSNQGSTDAQPVPETPAPPHVFRPVSHAPIHRSQGSMALSPSSLPRFVLRMRECFGAAPKSPQPQSIASGKGAPSPSSGPAAKATTRSSGRASAPLSKPAKPKADAAKDRLGTRASESKKATAPSASADLSYAAESAQAAPSPSEAPSGASAREGRERKEKRRIAADEEAPAVLAEPPATPAYDDWGAAIYLSNDDTMSLSSAQRVIYAIDQFLPLPIEHIRPHELLNYFSFDSTLVEEGYDFSVLGGLARDPASSDIYSLALSVRGRPVDLRSRRNAALTLVVDRSGSMDDEGRMSFLKRGLRVMLGQLKAGDIVNLVAFDDEVCVPAEGFVVGRDSMRELEQAIDALAPRGSTDLHRGLTRGYELADKTYQKSYTNRVLLVTDALTNTGVTDEDLIATVSRYFDNRRIRLSGVGVGREFNDSLLDKLTERGKGAYVFLGSQAEVDAVFGSHFLSLIETTANDVRFRLHLPPSLRMQVFYGEESSTVAADVQEIHYFANTSQLFLSDLMAKGGALRPDDELMLSIEYRDPETDESLVEQSSMRLGDLAADPRNIAKARLIMTWIDLIAQMAQSSQATNTYGRAGGWDDPSAFARCEQGTAQLDRLSSDLGQDPEVRRVLGLWSKFCSRYERPRQPVRRQIAAPPPDAWPGANQPSR